MPGFVICEHKERLQYKMALEVRNNVDGIKRAQTDVVQLLKKVNDRKTKRKKVSSVHLVQVLIVK